MPNLHFSDERVVQAGLEIIEFGLDYIYERIAPGKFGLDELWYERLKKWLLLVDHDVQLAAEELLEKKLAGIEIRGEESTLNRFDGELAALLDMLDGSDLLKRNLGNWCSAATIFDARQPRIITALVGMPNRDIYFTQNTNRNCAFLRTRDFKTSTYQVSEIRIDERKTHLPNASVCFYGQKPKRLVSFCDSGTRFGQWLKEVSREMDDKKRAFDCPKTRIYTLAGNPMMVNLIEGRIDAVVEVVGQKCHDVIPGFVIALRAGAILRDLSNRPITEAELAQSLRNPQSSFSYVLACNEALAGEIVELLRAKA